MAEYNLSFSSNSQDEGSFRLLELPPELYGLAESAVHYPLRFAIKGHTSDDAVLCTSDKTYALRSVVLSNTTLVVTSEYAPDHVVIRDQLNELLELVPVIPKLHKLTSLLRGMEYDDSNLQADEGIGNHDDDDDGDEDSIRSQTRCTPRTVVSYDDARAEIQASDAELHRALKERHILIIDGKLRPITSSYLNTILELLLNYIVSLSLPHHAAPKAELVSTISDEHEISKEVCTQVMSWFGEIRGDKWAMDVDAVLTEVGLGILRNYKDEPIPEDQLISKWKTIVGDTFEARVSLTLLLGNYLMSAASQLTYFPRSALPVDPAARFGDLFLPRPRWKHEEIVPFLSDIAVDAKDRDKILLKYARSATDSEGVWYTARTKYHG